MFPQGEVATLDTEALRKLIRENELKEEKELQVAQSEGSTGTPTRPAIQSTAALTPPRPSSWRNPWPSSWRNPTRSSDRTTNSWHLFGCGLLRRTDSNGQQMYSTYDDPLVKINSWNSLPEFMRKLLLVTMRGFLSAMTC